MGDTIQFGTLEFQTRITDGVGVALPASLTNDFHLLSVDDDVPDEIGNASSQGIPDEPVKPVAVTEPSSLDKLLRTAAELARTDGKFTGEVVNGAEDLDVQLDNWLYTIGIMFYSTGTVDPKHKALAASRLLGGRAATKIRKLSTVGSDGNPQLPTFDEIVQQLRFMVKGTRPGDVTLTIRVMNHCMLQAGLVTISKSGKTDLQIEIVNLQKELDKRSVPLDNISLCAVYVNAFRSIPVIQEQIRTFQDEDGVKVEQTNPDHLLRTIQQYE